jgi:hypothetical protein
MILHWAKRLKKEGGIYFKKEGRQKVNNKNYLDIPKNIERNGRWNIQQERIETLKIRTMDLLSDNSYWKTN